MEAALPRQWVVPSSLPQAWLATLQPPKPTGPQLRARRQPDEKEPPPPIPSKLLGRDCLYGFIVTDDLMETYNALDFPNDNTDSHFRRRENAHTAIHSVAERLGLKVSIDHPQGHDDIIWFSYAKAGIVQVKQVPIASKLERFATELGITEKAEWHDAWLDAPPFGPFTVYFHVPCRMHFALDTRDHFLKNSRQWTAKAMLRN
ncbi:hypothetical protein B0H11DRAFT_2230079 [Mycena galericulata]|nr:hypothetical protein B0H11DRAFT_2230079 [Mycena galericulata]